MDNSEAAQIIDNERLRWIAFFHYVSGGITIAFSLFFLIYVIIFGFVVLNPDITNKLQAQDPRQAVQVMKIFFVVFATLSTFGLVYGICEVVSGVFIKKRKYRVFSVVVAIPGVLKVPYGTILSIFTLTMLGQPAVKEQYENAKNERLPNKEYG